MLVESDSIKMSEDCLNPVSIAKLFLNKVKKQFSSFDDDAAPTPAESEVSDLLFQKFAKITENYTFIEENENDFITNPADAFSYLKMPTRFPRSSGRNSKASRSESDSESDDENDSEYNDELVRPKLSSVSLAKKTKIINLMKERPNWSFQSIISKYPWVKNKMNLSRWKKQVENGGTQSEIFYEVHKHTLEQFVEARARYRPVHDIDIRRWGLQKASEYPSIRTKFSASPRWVSYFKKAHKISSRKVTKIVSKRNMRAMEEILENVEKFRSEIQALQSDYKPENIWNTDQIGFNYEFIDVRTLSWTGEKITFGSGFSPNNKATHSYTVQYIISAAGTIVGPVFVCLQEPTGRLGPQVQASLFKASNVCVTCTNSGKLTKSQVKYFFENVAKPNINGFVLYILDSWGAHVECDAYEIVGEGNKLTVKVIPKNGTSVSQPLDVYFNRELKYFVKRISSFANINEIDITSRNDILKIHCLAHFTLSAPIFKNLIKYSWIKSGLVKIDKEDFENVRDVCFNFTEIKCADAECKNQPFYKCSWCSEIICSEHFFTNVHAFHCKKGPMSSN